LEQVNKVFPIGKELVPRQECYDTNALEVSKLEKYMWRIRVLGSQDISNKATQIYVYFLNALVSLRADDITKANDEINNAYKALTQLTIAMAQEIQQGILRKFCKWIRGMVRFG